MRRFKTQIIQNQKKVIFLSKKCFLLGYFFFHSLFLVDSLKAKNAPYSVSFLSFKISLGCSLKNDSSLFSLSPFFLLQPTKYHVIFTSYSVLKKPKYFLDTQAPHLVPKYIACRGEYSPYELPQFIQKKQPLRLFFA